ncbi:MAG: flavodoxin [Firmicutes bacterium]|nr:flavodoxin [Bacillota bacterium]MBQ2456115.1 flavodoxin [Bacillota bacterium]
MKTAIVYWSGTGNTEAMAKAVCEAAAAKGAEVKLYTASEFTADEAAAYDAFGFRCPAMGAEVLEEGEFEPMFSSVEGCLAGKKVGLFGSYGWGDGQWMRDWQDRTQSAGAVLVMDGVTANNEPDEDALAACRALGEALA